MSKKMRLFIPCYYAFFANGMMALVLGSILTYLIKEARLSYSIAGGLLSAFAIGNLLASFVNPAMAGKIGRKKTTIILSALVPIDLFMISLIPATPVLYVACILLGIGRGSVSIINNMVVNDYDGTPFALNLLHTVFAMGAFLAPFLTSLFVNAGLNWRYIIYTVTSLSLLSVLGYVTLPLEDKKNNREKNKNQSTQKENGFLKSPDFYFCGLLLFFYLGVENCVNGWFVTYFKGIGIMSDTYATNLVSITWIVIMLGRLTTGYLSKKLSKYKIMLINCSCTVVFFGLLIATKNLTVITIAVIGLGFFFAGIYPTGIANAGELIKGSTAGMSMLLAMAAMGGIITPQLVGVIADGSIGLTGAITFLSVNVAMMLLFAVISYNRSKNQIV
ncbi:fucose permease [Lachnotalea glycerini]|uniref:Fucose permease n=1 Tax=Lachnotalea glycerini TaxID=1763509 RepID=A0A255IMF5_9FIRM|nr:MFS transporter [Lachnotalea glycerini]PXV85693.1 fucose permease [Lachnotalea glycerini]RDY31372.1 MFS transporter [Lachnotalea glycerini]